jgi:hypothetical protein
MDGALKQVAIVAETTRGTIPTSPAWKICREATADGLNDKPFGESNERRANRRLAVTHKQLETLGMRLVMPFVYDDSTELLFQSLLNSAWSSNVIKDASTLVPLTVEERYEAGATDPYVWSAGMVVDSLELRLSNGQPGVMTWNLIGLAETTGTAAKSMATYADPSNNEVITPADVTVSTFFGLTPKMMDGTIRIANNGYRQYSWGSAAAFASGLARFRSGGDFSLYWETIAQYTTILPGVTGALAMTAGLLTTKKYTIEFPNGKASRPVRTDPGIDGDVMLQCHVDAMDDDATDCAVRITRAVA